MSVQSTNKKYRELADELSALFGFKVEYHYQGKNIGCFLFDRRDSHRTTRLYTIDYQSRINIEEENFHTFNKEKVLSLLKEDVIKNLAEKQEWRWLDESYCSFVMMKLSLSQRNNQTTKKLKI